MQLQLQYAVCSYVYVVDGYVCMGLGMCIDGCVYGTFGKQVNVLRW